MHPETGNDSLDSQMGLLEGESWFFYWKVSSSLWKSRFEAMQSTHRRVIVPINWSLHHIGEDRFDFAGERPETNLKRLVGIAQELNLEVIFLLPISPCPMMANGGTPSHLAKRPAQHIDMTPQKITLSDGHFTQLYSYFDPKVFMGFAQFTTLLGQYFSRSGIPASLYTCEFGHQDSMSFSSYFDDWSSSFEQAFFRYIKSAHPNEYEKILIDLEDNFTAREIMEKQFRSQIKSIYLNSAMEGIASNYEGFLKVHLLSGDLNQGFSLFPDKSSFTEIVEELVNSYQKGVIASSFLLHPKTKNNIIRDAYETLMVEEVYKKNFEISRLAEGNFLGFQALSHFEVFDTFDSGEYSPIVEENGLASYLKEEFAKGFTFNETHNFEFADDENRPVFEPLKYFSGHSLDEKSFNTLLKIFMSGHNIILDRSNIDLQLLKRLEIFLLENNLNVEKVNFMLEIHNIRLGEGRMTIFQSHLLDEYDAGKKKQFWAKLIETFEIKYLKVEQKNPLVCFWRTRPANSSELNYEEIRRVNLINTTSYLKKGKIELRNYFALKKVVKEENATVQHKSQSVYFEVLPGGEVIIDFGVFS